MSKTALLVLLGFGLALLLLLVILLVVYRKNLQEPWSSGPRRGSSACFPQEDCGKCSSPTDNPFSPMTDVYVQPSLKTNIDRLKSKVSDPVVLQKLGEIERQPSAYWIDTKEKIGKEVKQILDDARPGQKVVFIVYDLPNRDCNALSSNGQICCNTNPDCASACSIDCQASAKDCQQGLDLYKTGYIDPLVSLFRQYPQVTLILIIEPDSLPNCATNKGQRGCTDLTCTVYSQGVTYALENLSALSNAVLYMDAGHGGWLGWENNLMKFKQIVVDNKFHEKLRGFVTNVSNYQPLGASPCNFSSTGDYNSFVTIVQTNNAKGQCGYDPCGLSSQYNAANNELNYVQLLAWAFRDVAFLSPDGRPRFVIDTGRNGNPDARGKACDVWCNPANALIGQYPTTTTALPGVVDAYFWLKTPGESDGCIDVKQQQKCDNTDGYGSQCARYDPNCGTHPENIGYQSSQPCPPEAGDWFDYQMLMLAGADVAQW